MIRADCLRKPLEWGERHESEPTRGAVMDSIDELDMYEAEKRLALYNEYRDAARVFTYYVETELRAYLANEVTVEPTNGPGGVFFKVTMVDVWIYEAERINRFVPETIVYAVGDVHIQRLKGEDE
jgi:hypothetical protein